MPAAPLFPGEAESALAQFDELRLVDLPGAPRMGEVAKPWIRDLVSAVFGAYDVETGRRLIAEFFLLISKKNYKSTTAAAIMMTALIRNWREDAEYLILAPTIEVANNSFVPARAMVKRDGELADLFLVQNQLRTITHRVTGASLKVVAASDEVVGGKKTVGLLVDELWLFGKQPNADDMLREAAGGLQARPEGFVIYLSTQSNAAPAGVFKSKLDYARAVRDGQVVDRRFLPVLYEFPPDMVKDGKIPGRRFWHLTNPSAPDPEFLDREFQKAQHAGTKDVLGFYAKHLNIEIGLQIGAGAWAGALFWEQQGRAEIDLDWILANCEVVTVGIDGGGLDDLLGLAVLGRVRGTLDWVAWGRAWAHPKVLELRKEEAARFKDFERDGDLVIAEIGPDLEALAAIVAKVEDAGLLDAVGIDPAGLGQILDALADAGVPQEKVKGISQGWKLTGAIKTAERKLAEGALLHAKQPLMTWCVGNAKVEPRGNAVLITKQASGTAKIDPLMALFDAVFLMALNPAVEDEVTERLVVI